MTKPLQGSEFTLLVFNEQGGKLEFSLSREKGQYSIGKTADIALAPLTDQDSRRGMDGISGYLTFINEAWYFRAAKGFRRGAKAVYLNEQHVYAATPEVVLGGGDTLRFGDSKPVKAMLLSHRTPLKIIDTKVIRTNEFDDFRFDFESMTNHIVLKLNLPQSSKPETVMQELQRQGLHDRAFEYGLVRVMRNMVAHPSRGIEAMNRDYFVMAHSLLKSLLEYAKPKEKQ